MTLPTPTRAAGLARLAAFAPRAGHAYAAGRNEDPGPDQPGATSGLSPWIRHRLVTEQEVAAAALIAHGPEAAGKFLQEVFWRTYWKGWLELRPAIWSDYRRKVAEAQEALATDAALRARHDAAVEGRTGIACFDAWATELRETGTLHNHARMWFASIWAFTLRLPWVLGADHFLRHLRDGDAASNTLSWRWVIGTQTRGKPYVARAENIARYTAGRFDPAGQLDEDPTPILEAEPPGARPLPPAAPAPDGPVALLLHEDDLAPESLDLGNAEIRAIAGFAVPRARSPAGCTDLIAAWTEAALDDAIARAARHFDVPVTRLAPNEVAAWTAGATIVTPWAPVGWTADTLADIEATQGLRLHRLRRPWDSLCWPHATRGFFPFRERIPGLLRALL
jgi:deoxyribodipyrimidine photo-lyase